MTTEISVMYGSEKVKAPTNTLWYEFVSDQFHPQREVVDNAPIFIELQRKHSQFLLNWHIILISRTVFWRADWNGKRILRSSVNMLLYTPSNVLIEMTSE